MSKPKRYDVGMTTEFNPHGFNHSFPRVYEAEQGKYVEYEDYARLKAEVERLTKASQGAVKYVDHTMALTRQSMEHHKQVSRLEAYVERLTKAGDELIHGLAPGGSEYSMNENIERWNAAKEGKPHA